MNDILIQNNKTRNEIAEYIKNLLTNLEIKNNTLKYILLVPRNDLDLSDLPENISIEVSHLLVNKWRFK